MVQKLMKERREKVEEIKKKTNYYSTRDLIQRYDEISPATPLQPRVNPVQSLPVTPQQQQPFPNNINTNGKAVNPALQAQLSRASILLPFVSGLLTFFFTSIAISPLLAQPQRRQWYDRLADLILGDDDPNIASPNSRYALICEKCFAHNGLVKESMLEDARKLLKFLAVILERLTFCFFLKNMFVRNAITSTRPHVQNDCVNNKTLPQMRLPRHRLKHLPLLLDSRLFFSHHRNQIFPTWTIWRWILKLMYLPETFDSRLLPLFIMFSLYILNFIITIFGLQVATLRFANYLLPNIRGKYCALIDVRFSPRRRCTYF